MRVKHTARETTILRDFWYLLECLPNDDAILATGWISKDTLANLNQYAMAYYPDDNPTLQVVRHRLGL